MIYTDPLQAAPAIADALESAQRILLVSHVNPDGDAIGSMLGVWHALNAMGKTALPLASSALPGFVSVLPGIEHVQVYERGTPLPEADLIWLVDAASLSRVGPISDDHAATLADHPLVIVDHHVTNEGEGTVNLIDAEATSCAELVYSLLCGLNIAVSPAAATCLLLGMITDTQSFQTSGTRPQTLRVAADLLEAGADKQSIVQQIYYATPYSTAQILGMALSHMGRDNPGGNLVWTQISQEMMQQTGADDAAYDDVLLVMQRIEGVQICALFKEREDGRVKLSLRSKPDIDVAALARRWGGGGHRQAAGATLDMGLGAAQQEVLAALRERLKG